MQNSSSANLDISIASSGVATLTFSHPPTNAMPIVLLEDLANAIEKLAEDSKVQIIILQSGGERTFCSGADFNQLLAIDNLEDGKIFFSGFAKVINACRKSSKIIIGRVQGKAVGGGVGLAAATDYCFATQAASVKLSELHIGIIPAVIEPAVSRKIGLSSFSKMSLKPTEFYSAQWALEQGLFYEVFETIAEMDEAIGRMAEQLATYNPEGLQELKKILWQNTNHWDTLLYERAEISGKLVLSEFTKQALRKI
ncbi:enoyl-CoA hydratase/isomerase family protein [Cellulophaga sp. BC115SP]|uniref:enoyl-CoA hydratase/isomerase family protein n=1 Tax=Cellulophaga sp. BC115SP TaxID=2683263 RepID=UPI001411BD4E|nr:enoyl-CoA hydratase/isomerase family protein [Cellulophaga sp. BC115SP]NBB29404.1 enoyl-CoA hydratase/isomerase family protein [Cellulophaga sp. BC115SP]